MFENVFFILRNVLFVWCNKENCVLFFVLIEVEIMGEKENIMWLDKDGLF